MKKFGLEGINNMKDEEISAMIDSAIYEAKKESYNQALDDCLCVCNRFRDYDQDRDCKSIIDEINDLRKE